jgi:hypothetical protein
MARQRGTIQARGWRLPRHASRLQNYAALPGRNKWVTLIDLFNIIRSFNRSFETSLVLQHYSFLAIHAVVLLKTE